MAGHLNPNRRKQAKFFLHDSLLCTWAMGIFYPVGGKILIFLKKNDFGVKTCMSQASKLRNLRQKGVCTSIVASTRLSLRKKIDAAQTHAPGYQAPPLRGARIGNADVGDVSRRVGARRRWRRVSRYRRRRDRIILMTSWVGGGALDLPVRTPSPTRIESVWITANCKKHARAEQVSMVRRGENPPAQKRLADHTAWTTISSTSTAR